MLGNKTMSSTSLSASEDLHVDVSDAATRDAKSTERPSINVRLEDHIRLGHLQHIMHEFLRHTPKDDLLPLLSKHISNRTRKQMPGNLNLEEFKATIAKVVGTDDYNEYLDKLFIKLDTSGDGFVDWNEFCTHLLLVYRENDYLCTKSEKPFMEDPKIRHISHNKQEPTTKTVAVHGPVRYLTISKEGCMSVWQPQLVFEKHYVLAGQIDEMKRRFQMWVTDAVYMKNCEKVAIGSSSRDIRFYDVSSSQYFEEYHLFAMADVPYCFDYHYNEKQPNMESLLIFGVDTGAIHLLTFLRPVTQLFENTFHNDGGVQKIFMQDIGNHSNWVHHRFITNIHQNIICQVRYLPENEVIISGSASSKSSVVICDLMGVNKSYVFRMEKGVECFDHNKTLNLLATGSSDHLVRLWNPYVTNSPMATLHGHATGIIGVIIHEEFRQVFSYSKDAVIKAWDTKEHACLQTVALKFPSSIDGRMPEHGQFPIHLQGPPYSVLIVTCNDYIASLRLGKLKEVTSSMDVTHDTQLCGASYNKLLKQVATGCDSSTISVWELTTGQRSCNMAGAHGKEEITCLAFDVSGRRLISGARDGTVKVWNCHNGHNLHKLEPVSEAEVTNIIHLPDKKCILTVGWSQMIVSYNDSDAENKYISGNTSWSGGQLHKDDILTADFTAPNFLATGSYDGEIIVWETDTERMHLRLRRGQPPNISEILEELKTTVDRSDDAHKSRSGAGSRPNSRHRSSHKVEGQIAPVDKLLFLKVRAAVRFTECAVLVSSEGGVLRWWNIYTVHKEMGYFYAASVQDESVLAMCVAHDDSVLMTGDTRGVVRCWNIQEYCLKFEGYVTQTAPPIDATWKAHDAAIVSVDHVQHDYGNFVLTASTDKTARLWTADGHFIGTFGQREPWSLRNPLTWAHPRTPWSKDELPASSDIKDMQNKATTTSSMVKRFDELAQAAPEGVTHERDPQMGVTTAPGLLSREKSYIRPIQTFLGVKAKQDLIRRQRDRKERRSQFGNQSRVVMSGFGQHCVPYHALTAPEWHNVEMPTHLPLPQRLQGQGHTGNNFNADNIQAIDFTYSQSDLDSTIEEKKPHSGVMNGTVKFLPPAKDGQLPTVRNSSIKQLGR